MRYDSCLIVVSSIEASKKFYTELLGQTVLYDFGECVSFGGFSLQEKKLWAEFLQKNEGDIRFGALDAELYFNEDDFDAFLERLDKAGIEKAAPPVTHSWGQRAVRFYDPDRHIIEVAESMEFVCRRMLASGLSVEETAELSQHPVEFVRDVLKTMGDEKE